MAQKTAWSHLPNAVHIDRVLASVTTHPDEWSTARHAAWSAAGSKRISAAWGAAWGAARDAAWRAAWDVARSAAAVAVGDAASYAARDAIAALVAYDDCAHYLDMPSDKLEVWAILSEKSAAILLLPAVTAFEKIKELELV